MLHTVHLEENPLIATHTSGGNSTTNTTNLNSQHKLLVNREIPAIVQYIIPPVHQATGDEVSTSGGDLHVLHTVHLEEIVTSTMPSAARVFKDPPVVNWNNASRLVTVDMNTV